MVEIGVSCFGRWFAPTFAPLSVDGLVGLFLVGAAGLCGLPLLDLLSGFPTLGILVVLALCLPTGCCRGF